MALGLGVLPLIAAGTVASPDWAAAADPTPPTVYLFDAGGFVAPATATLDVVDQPYTIQTTPGGPTSTITVNGSSLASILALAPAADYDNFTMVTIDNVWLTRAQALATGPGAPVFFNGDNGQEDFADGNPADYVPGVLFATMYNSPPLTVSVTGPSTVETGQPVTLSVSSNGTPSTTYSWADVDPDAAGPLTYGTAFTHTFLTPGTRHIQVNATDTAGGAIGRSDIFALTVTQAPAAPAVTTQPASATVPLGQAASFTAAADGSPAPSVQWQTSSDHGATWTPVPGATATTYTTAPTTGTADGTQYRAVFTNTEGGATTTAATLSIQPAKPSITHQPKRVKVKKGRPAVFAVTATGWPAPTYVWQYSTGKGKWKKVGGAHAATYRVAGKKTRNGRKYRVIVKNAAGQVTSKAVKLTVKKHK